MNKSPNEARRTESMRQRSTRGTNRLPAVISLQSFEATARLGSVSRAAEELRLTQSAVSRQILALEERLGVKLFSRGKQRLSLSEAGAVYLREVRSALEILRGATEHLVSHRGVGGMLKIATLPTFGAHWLMPRLARFRQAHPHIALDLITRTAPFDFSMEQIDGAIHFGGSEWPGATAEYLAEEEMVAVATPAIAAQCRVPADVVDVATIQITTRAFAWHEWLTAQGMAGQPIVPELRVETFAMGIEAARVGLGVALLPLIFVEEVIGRGELVVIGARVRSESAYYFVYPDHKSNNALLRTFAEWLVTESDCANAERRRG